MTMRRESLAMAALIVLTLGAPIWACMWDDDTLAVEARGMPDVISIIVGRFERNPPLYYEMRLKSAAKRIEKSPDDFEAYDNAGVACDRLGRGENAISWMEEKRERLDRAGSTPEVKEHRYRYLANVGTFWVHRWARAGSDRNKIDEVKKARDFIAEAIKLNPNAHFGREKYQLMALDWIVKPPVYDPKSTFFLPTFLGDSKALLPAEAAAAVRGLTGLIALGNAWESVDVFNAPVEALYDDGEKTYVATLARWRCEELVMAGKKSLLPGAPTGEKLGKMIQRPRSMARNEAELKEVYKKLRVEADDWQKVRTAYMMDRLKSGRHPDSDPSFWNDYRDSHPPELTRLELSLTKFQQARPPVVADYLGMSPWDFKLTVAIAAVACGVFVGGLLWRRRRRTNAKRPIGEKLGL